MRVSVLFIHLVAKYLASLTIYFANILELELLYSRWMCLLILKIQNNLVNPASIFFHFHIKKYIFISFKIYFDTFDKYHWYFIY